METHETILSGPGFLLGTSAPEDGLARSTKAILSGLWFLAQKPRSAEDGLVDNHKAVVFHENPKLLR